MKHSTPRTRVGSAPRNCRKKPRNRRKPNYRLLSTLFCVSALLSCAGSYAVQSPDLVVKEVEIRGIHQADKAVVQQAAKSVLGKNIILVRKNHIVSQISAVSEIRTVRMGRAFPCKIWVELEERKALAALACGGKYFLLQDDGLAFHEMPRPQQGLPILDIAGRDGVKEGAQCCDAGVQCALQIARFGREHHLSVAKISVDRLGDICLNMGSGFYVKLGQPDELARKLSLLQRALVYKPSLVRDGSYIDLSCPDACVWKPKNGAGSAS